MILAAHQPNFVPNFAFFEKLRSCDLFVILTEVQFEKNNFQNRFWYENEWFTMRTIRGNIPINQKLYVNPWIDFEEIQKKLSRKGIEISKFRDVALSQSLAETNIALIRLICSMLEIDTPIVTDYPTELKATNRLVDLCKHFGADVYLSGPSGRNYLNLDRFNEEGISVSFFDSSKYKSVEIIEELAYAKNS
jgi:hypothetical protein